MSPSKKVVKKIVKKVKKSVKAVGGDTMTVSGPQNITVMVNGQVTGSILDDQTLGAAAEAIATKAGVRSFSVKINGKKVEQPEYGASLKGVKTFEIYAKDSRG